MVPNVLCLCRDSPDPRGLGGLQIHVAALAERAPADARVFTAYPAAGMLVIETWRPARRPLALVPIPSWPSSPLERSPALVEALETAIASVEADVLHVHAPSLGPASLVEAVDRLGTGLVLTIHDHSLVCEDYRLLEEGLRYCGIPNDPARCDRCLHTQFHLGAGHLSQYRAAMSALTSRADVIVSPSEAARDLATRIHPGVRDKCRVIPWGVPDGLGRDAVPPPFTKGVLRVAVVGVMATVKGRERLPDLIGVSRDLPVEWHLFGATEGQSDRHLRHAGRVISHGAYAREQLPGALAAAGIGLAVLPSIAPETFSLTLSEVQAAGLPALVSHLGALAERVAGGGVGWTFDPWDAASCRERLEWLLADPSRLAAARARVRELPLRTESAMAADHVAVWRAAACAHPPPLESFARNHARQRARESRHAAGRRGRRTLERWARRLRQASWYRDFRLRAILSEGTRRNVETAARRLVDRWTA